MRRHAFIFGRDDSRAHMPAVHSWRGVRFVQSMYISINLGSLINKMPALNKAAQFETLYMSVENRRTRWMLGSDGIET